MQPCDKRFGQNICSIRKAKKLTQSELAEKSDCSEKYLGDIERGKKLPSFGLLTRISFALETPVDSFLVFYPISSYPNQIDATLARKISILKPPYLEALNGMLDELIKLQETAQTAGVQASETE